jgi:hypothetical protein
MEDLYYLEGRTTDASGKLVPFVVSVFAENEHDARAFLLDSMVELQNSVDLGEVRKAIRTTKHRGFLFSRAFDSIL